MLQDGPTIEIIRGDTKAFRFTATEDDEPIDLTGAWIYCTVRTGIPAGTITSDADAAAVIKMDTDGNGVDVIDAANGIFDLSFVTLNTKSLETPEGGLILYYGIEADMTPTSSFRKVLGNGKLIVYPDYMRQ